ncbi:MULTISPECIES: hypothetical protein [Amycolatopsis]|uniref:Uncharacterized protein n=2 Tax=Amycolatopsis TaxID=1813 RepID=A0A558A7R1_9PSEU|nr:MULTISPECIES: hypothetical protein [Amycolatopsis]MBB2505562.1 hypothetical protein [Amycolatopsis echigonensis]TVT20302.1 hypothetical protein FNH06_21120 [Amycolatopsis acidiphila]UIJ59682.1 hypothetical protein LWP59_37635 [Amycolatopsis acidiphila]GHG81330.1 hypothetical protein GCM10017788_51150 [Amycolatopsis acidiphila]
MPRRQFAPDDAVDCTTVSGRDCAEVFAAAAEWLADPAQAEVQVWGIDLDQPRRADRESDADVYLELFYKRSDDGRSTEEHGE